LLDLIDESPQVPVLWVGIAGIEDVAVWGGLMTAIAAVNKLASAMLNGCVL